MTHVDDLRDLEERLLTELDRVRDRIKQAEGESLGKLPNSRGGFHHIHSNSYECGIAYWHDYNDYDQPGKGEYQPCKKLVNHGGLCGYEDNSAY